MNKLLTTLVITLLSSQAIAADRALLIGVGKYQMKQANLPGIELDLSMMQKTAQSLGFQHIETLQDEQATLKNVEDALLALSKEVDKNDRVLIYYSGHGTFVPDKSHDETDQHDEALTMHDMKLGGGTFNNVLIDDRFSELLDKIPSDHILVLLDACHSGTATRAAISKYVPKEFHWEGMGKISKTRGFAIKAKQNANQSRIVTLSAAQDDEQSLASHEGSLFTVGLNQAIQQATANNTPFSPSMLQQSITAFLKEKITENASVFHPQLSGKVDLLQQPIALQAFTPTPQAAASNIVKPTSTPSTPAKNNTTMAQRLAALLEKAQPLTVQLNQNQFKKGDKLAISVAVTQSGYLNIIEVNANDQATILFPNQYHQDNQVQPGNFALPTAQMNFDLTAGEPFGHSTVLAFLTTEKVNLYSSNGQLNELFKTVTETELPSISRAFTPTQKQQAILAGKAETSVCATDADC